ncbi:EscU/YscU/HrcU family type III secretion system export apparatus switch protein [Jeotgalibacillus sp. ET6]|uniref:EscU/YscU/HrcU family type III secretion system export apparatus switch protein n=1 Tax=Jeotgalibacillus sp. ET6 TaxID=3037260 RepID=UPI0024185685|nr:EscU/YscU/HrcU family type III secretion system export apparatus switch protein [Jeotgalibacillus sp. ET6]MDG5470273.1 EscU/YscU/HrcU family type III secretion system export apparatus switch protein [Jeotgalibacillus sp. ET6]
MKKKPVYKRKQAVALTYNQELSAAPVVTGKGKGLTAENIIEKAREHNVPIQEDPALVELLSQLEVNESIPDDLYQAVAEVFAFIYRLDQTETEK